MSPSPGDGRDRFKLQWNRHEQVRLNRFQSYGCRFEFRCQKLELCQAEKVHHNFLLEPGAAEITVVRFVSNRKRLKVTIASQSLNDLRQMSFRVCIQFKCDLGTSRTTTICDLGTSRTTIP